MPLLIQHPTEGPFWAWPDSVGQALQRGEFWDAHLKPTMDTADPSGWAIDLGASFGWFTCYLAKRYAGVIAVEAHPTTYALLRQNLDLRGLDDVQAHCCAAYDRVCTLQMGTPAEQGWTLPSYLDLDEAGCASGVAFHPWSSDELALRVTAMPVDALIPDTLPVSLIKIDVQGCDLRALWGLHQTIARCRPTILFEYESISQTWHGDPFEAYQTFFDARDYVIAQLHPAFSDFLAVPR